MAKICKCGKPVFSKGLCKNCWLKVHAKPLKRTALKPTKTKIKQVSEPRKKKLKGYTQLRKEWLPNHPDCEANLSGCTKESTQVHHKQGREGDLLLDTTKWLAICDNCHIFITDNSKIAIELGLSLRRNTL